MTVDRFGSINPKKGPSPNIELKRRKDRQAQVMVPKPRKSIHEIKFEFKQKIDIACETFGSYNGYHYECCISKKR